MLIDATQLLTPTACAHPELVLGFLRASRKVSDDNIRNRLGQVDCLVALNEIYKEWQMRDNVLNYCKSLEGNSSQVSTTSKLSELSAHSRDEIEFATTQTDPRVDAYTSRDETMKPNQNFDWVHTEIMSESIIRESTMQAIIKKCGFDLPKYNVHK